MHKELGARATPTIAMIAGKPGSSSRFTSFLTPFDLTRYVCTASESRVIMSGPGKVRRCKNSRPSKTALA